MSVSKTYSVKTLGCKANLYDSQLLEAELQRRGWVSALRGEEPDLCIVNSCSVTDEADRQSRKAASRAAGGRTRVVMTGCGAEIDPEAMRQAKGVNYVVGNQDKESLVDLVIRQIESEPADESLQGSSHSDGLITGKILGGVSSYSELRSRHPMDREWNLPESSFMLPPVNLAGDAGRVRSFIKIQEGCDSFCTYCIIPYGRGPSRSLPLDQITNQVTELVAKGVREVVITGTNIGDYGRDWNDGHTAIEDLIEAILKRTPLERLRLSSLDPVEISPRMLEIMRSETRLQPHFHVSLQSPNAKVLKLMKRKYSELEVERTLRAIDDLPAPAGGIFVGMDVITGFPGETEAEFEDSVKRLTDLPWTRLHVFPYSERKNTPATRLPESVVKSRRAERAAILRELSLKRLSERAHEALKNAQSTGRGLAGVLLESETSGPHEGAEAWIGGHTPNYFRVLLEAPKDRISTLTNTIVRVTPQSVLTDRAAGEVAFLARICP